MSDLTALVLSCTLKKSSASSSSVLLGTQILDALAEHDVTGGLERVVDYDVHFGVSVDEGDGDAWPELRSRVMAADILVLTTPIWLGQPSSVCKMVLERLNAEMSQTDDEGRMLTYGKVAVIGVVGNEDGAHHVTAELYQALSDCGFTIPANGVTYWVGEAMQKTDYQDKQPTPEQTVGTTQTLAVNAAHLARLLRDAPYPPSA